ncbi:MAG: glutamate-5-semialdehyde dehydrogenase [Spirochaetes bacterium]|nr:MAG: glutamate-5-semialdehyde dehydrogenase [Spirochaetota bacterium]
MDNNAYILDLCVRARKASHEVRLLSSTRRTGTLHAIAATIRARAEFIIAENAKDMKAADAAGLSSALRDRLLLDGKRIEGIARSIEEIALLEDPIGRVENMKLRPSGIRVGQMRVPIGVIAVIYESRPNVTTDIAALCLKSGNACVLRGGSESINSNRALYTVVRDTLAKTGAPVDAVLLVEHTDRALVSLLLKMNTHIDIVIPRGGQGLIDRVTQESTIPVIKHDKGVCHTYVDASADRGMAERICVNAKVQRPGVCNAMETLLIHAAYPHATGLLEALAECGVQIRGCDRTARILPERVTPATEEDWSAEYLELILAVKIVDSMDDAIAHIMRYGSNHSEAIVTADYFNAERFLGEVDSSAVFVNSSTRFHDGGEFGLGAEVGISTQKLHARGTMGIEGLTCLKYIIYGTGQVRS